MGEVKRISISLKVNTGDETYWGLIEPLQTNRQLSTFIITCLKAYVEDGDIHDAIDAFNRKGTGVDKLREHIDNLIKLQAKANRTAEDISTSLSGNAEELEIDNVFDDEIDEPDDDEIEQSSPVVERRGQVATRGRQTPTPVRNNPALPEGSGALEKIIKRLDKLEGTVSSLSSKVGSNSEHITQIESSRGKAETVIADKVEPVAKEVKLDEVSDKPDVASKSEDNLDFSQLIGDFMSSVST